MRFFNKAEKAPAPENKAEKIKQKAKRGLIWATSLCLACGSVKLAVEGDKNVIKALEKEAEALNIEPVEQIGQEQEINQDSEEKAKESESEYVDYNALSNKVKNAKSKEELINIYNEADKKGSVIVASGFSVDGKSVVISLILNGVNENIDQTEQNEVIEQATGYQLN